MPERLNRAYLALGSNIDPEENLLAAVRALSEHGRIVAASGVWQSPPADCSHQDNYLNAAVLLETHLDAPTLCRQAIHRIEVRLKRVRDPNNKNAPRTIDIDVAFFNREILEIDHRKIPDPEILERAFLAVPLAEIDPRFVHPLCGQTLKQIAEELEPDSPLMKLRPDVALWPK